MAESFQPSDPDPSPGVAHHNARAWDRLVQQEAKLTLPATDEDLVDPLKTVDPLGWLGPSVQGKKTLCLAAGGGRQSVLYAASGADVTVLDISQEMLVRDREAAQRHGLSLRVVQGSMDDLGTFSKAEFDLVIHPVSSCYVPDVQRVYQQVARVLKGGGLYVSQHKSPVSLQTGSKPQGGKYQLEETYYREGPLPASEPSRLREPGTLEFLHRWEQLIGGLCRTGFVIEDLVEPMHADHEAKHGSFGHRGQYIAPYVRIKARRVATASSLDSPGLWTPT